MQTEDSYAALARMLSEQERTGRLPYGWQSVELPDLQPDLFQPMCASNVAVQQLAFAPDPPKAKTGPRVPDLPGQETFA